jgi:hypothetical protein
VAGTSPALSFIAPNQCNDQHDAKVMTDLFGSSS